ncbi:M20/M25/M40 family metallo-hydrolase [Spirosoma sp. KUDC1026]|uniref:M20/M25/M40 family metallo-hydrolase n=1 Tax=Spirosoma sp. KUDC1026 TaxID=2745947 RepID=UPI00159BA6C3|nr:M20/M25/M40 family metallo-hydrolase [Spirosoma sp. KUDC1026]QKZ11362.1 M20/M25/M40 family metallo-hydrolase [Spirosoma sp. KUDC1026]
MHRKLYVSPFQFVLLCAGAVGCLTAFLPAKNSLEKTFARINEEVNQHSRAYETLADASKTIGHRLTGSANGSKAEAYAYQLLSSYGFKDIRYEPFEVEAWTRDTVTLSVVPRRSDDFREVPVVALAHSPVDAHVSGEIVDVGNGLEGDFAAVKDKIKGKVALVNIGLAAPTRGARNLHRSEKTALAIQYGASGVIMVNLVPGNVLLTGTASVTGKLIPIPSVCISLESGQALRTWMQETPSPLEATIDMTNKSRKIRARNVIATLKGSKLSDEKIVVGGHLDSWDLATGAIDNGIGSFAVMDIARTFKALKLKPKRTIEFVLFMGEEQGLLGSKAMVDGIRKAGKLDHVRYMLNLDMTNDPTGLNAFGRQDMVPFLNTIGETMKQIEPAFANQMQNQAGLHSDHQPFMLEGIPVVGMNGHLERSVLDCYHANCDRINLVNANQMKNTVRYATMLLYALADADQLPAKRQTDTQTRDYLTAQGLRTPLQLANEWRWKE